jgi:alpha-ribazole phosphatase
MIRLLLVRHGQTAWSIEHRYQGKTDTALDEIGQRQAAALGRYFGNVAVDAIYSSTLRRAEQTAAAISSAASVPVSLDERLRETSFGLWEGLTYSEIKGRYPQELAAWQNDPMRHTPPQGENLQQLSTRVASFLRDLEQQHAGQTVVCVAHGGVVRAVICHALALPSPAFWRLEIGSASVSELHLSETCPPAPRALSWAGLRPSAPTDTLQTDAPHYIDLGERST